MKRIFIKSPILPVFLLLAVFALIFFVNAPDGNHVIPDAPDSTLVIPYVSDSDYVIPDEPDGVDLGLVIGSVGGAEITLGDFAERVRYERFRYYNTINFFVDDMGTEIFNLDDPDNPLGQSIQANIDLLVSDDFAGHMYEQMLLERMYEQEVQQRELEVSECDVNNNWAQQLRFEAVAECEWTEGFEEAKAEHIRLGAIYSGMSEEEIEQLVVHRTQYIVLFEEVGAELEIADLEAVRSRHIRVMEEETANEVWERLEAGEDFMVLLEEYTVDDGWRGNGGDLGWFATGEMIPEFEAVAFSAEIGEYSNPVATQFGYHVIEVLDREMGVRLRHILLGTQAEAEAAQVRLDAGEDFSDLVRELSLDASATGNDGDMGWFGRGQMVAEFENAAFDSEVGAIVIVETDFGHHVIEVLDKKSTPRTQHLLLATEGEAQHAAGLIEAGEDVAELAALFSLDISIDSPNPIVAELFEQEVAGAEAGDVIGPLQTELGFYVIKVIEAAGLPSQVHARHILLETEEEALAVSERLAAGDDFIELARELSIDPSSSGNNGDLGSFIRGQLLPENPDFEEIVFTAEYGQIIGPLQTDYGFHLLEVAGAGDIVSKINARHILLASEADALAVLERLNGGEDFADLARELSLDPTAGGNGGDTLALASGGQGSGLYVKGSIAPEFDVVFDAEEGAFVGPVETSYGFFIFQAQEFEMVPVDPTAAEEQRGEYVMEWHDALFNSDHVIQTGLWHRFIPAALMPSDVYGAQMAEFDRHIEDAAAQYKEAWINGTIPNLLDVLRIVEFHDDDE